MKKLPSIPVSDANSKDNAVLAVIMSEDETITCCEKKVRALFDLSKSVRIKLIPMVTVKKILLIA